MGENKGLRKYLKVKPKDIGIIFYTISLIVFLASLQTAWTRDSFYTKSLFMLFAIFVTVGSIIINRVLPISTKKEMFLFFSITFVFFTEYIWYKVYLLNEELPKLAYISILCLFINIVIFIRGFKTFHIKNVKIYNNIPWLFCSILFIFLNHNIFNYWIKSDGYIYYQGFFNSIGTWDFSLSTIDAFSLAGHMTYSYSLFWTMGVILFGDIGIKIMNMFMAIQ